MVFHSEHFHPQLERTDWINLNGTWTFTFDFDKSEMYRKLFNSKSLIKSILERKPEGFD